MNWRKYLFYCWFLLPYWVGAVPFEVQKTSDGVVIRWQEQYGKPEIREQVNRLVLVFPKQTLQEGQKRILDDAFLPIRSVMSQQVGEDSQIVVEFVKKGDYQLSNSQPWQQLEIRPLPAQEKIQLRFQNIEVRQLLQLIAEKAKMNLLVSDQVQGKMSLSVRDMNWEQILNLVLDAQKLERHRYGDTWRISPSPSAAYHIDEGSLQTQIFRLRYLTVESLQAMFQTSVSSDKTHHSLLSKQGNILFDKSNNSLIIKDIPEVLKNVQSLLNDLDVPARQVMVEARIVEAGEGVAQEIGVKFGVARQGQTSLGHTWNQAWKQHQQNEGVQGFEPNINLPVSLAAGSVALIHPFSSTALGLELSAMEQDNRTKTISRPRVLTQDQKQAEIKQGFQIPYQTRHKDGESSTAFKDAVLSLKVLPRITPDNRILLDIAINKDAVDRSLSNFNGEPAIATQQLNTQVMVENGGTLVLGGVYQDNFSNMVRKVPLLGDLPVLGHLFQSKVRNQSRNELLFFITPVIMDYSNSTSEAPPQYSNH